MTLATAKPKARTNEQWMRLLTGRAASVNDNFQSGLFSLAEYAVQVEKEFGTPAQMVVDWAPAHFALYDWIEPTAIEGFYRIRGGNP